MLFGKKILLTKSDNCDIIKTIIGSTAKTVKVASII